MAEVFGVVAGAIGILQMTIKTAQIFRSIPEIESDFEDLCEEIEDIEDWVNHARATIPSSAATIIENKIAQTARRLAKINEDLKRIEAKLKKEMGDRTFKVKKAKWLVKADAIGKLLQKARNAKHDLAHAVDWRQLAMMDQMMQNSIRTEQTTTMMRDYLVLFANSVPPSDVRPKKPRRVEELHDSGADADEEEGWSEGQYQEAPPPGDDTDPEHQEIAHRASLQPRTGVITISTGILVQRMMPSCPEDCYCGCHAGGRRRRNAGWAGNLLSYLGVHYDLPSWEGGQDSRCLCDGHSWYVEYRPPAWLEARAWLLSGSFGLAGPMYSLRAARVVPWSNSLWTYMRMPAEMMRYWIMNGGVVYPDDQHESGRGIIEFMVGRRSFDTLELLLTEWKNVLPRQGVSRRAGWAANAQLELLENVLDERKSKLLHQVVSYSEIVNELVTSRVHQAAKQGHGMAEALEQDGWALNLLDHSGRAPLHWAASRGHVDAVQRLIDAGADVNMKTMAGWTPLIFPVRRNDADCARRLLDAGCRTDHTDMNGETALHKAVQCGSVDIVKLLLSRVSKEEAKALAAAPALLDGMIPLYGLAASVEMKATPEAIEEIAKLLLEAHPGAIDAKDKFGRTPASFAISYDNVPFLRCLVRAGGFSTFLSLKRRNLLHVIAGHASSATVDFLLQQAIAGHRLPPTDHRLNGTSGDSPWDELVYYTHLSPWRLGSMRHAGRSFQVAFVKLYRHIRDTNLRHDISTVQDALESLRGVHISAARDRLYDLAKHKADGYNDDAAAWYHSLAKKIDAGEIDGAADELEQDLKDLRDELRSDSWEQHSRRDSMALTSQWLEVLDASFWIEPAAAFELQDVHDERVEAGEQQEQLFDCPGGAGRSLNYDLITHIYSDRGHLLYDRSTAPIDPREFLRPYEGESNHETAKLELEHKSNADDREEASPSGQDLVSAEANRLEKDAQNQQVR